MQQITDFEPSLQQRRVWQRQELEGQAAYTAQALLTLEGEIQPERLEAAIAEVVSRYEILRTGFVHITGQPQPLVTINADAKLNWEIVYLRDAKAEAQSIELERLWQAELRLQAKTEQFEVLRARLALLSERNACLLLHLPALCGDAQTLRNLITEITRAYSGTEVDHEPLQYPDLSEWQNELIESADGERGKNYWRNSYSANWFASSSAGSASFAPRVLSLEIDPQLFDKLSAVPLFQKSASVFLLSCWSVLLWRLRGGTSEVFVTVSHDGRAYEELKDAIGLLEKYLPLGCRPEPNEHLDDVAERVEQALRDNEKWQEHFNWENFDGSEGGTTQFLPFAYDYDSHARREWKTLRANFTLAKQWVCTDRFNVKLRCAQLDHTLTTEWHYDSAFYDTAEIRQLAERYQKLLTSVANNPQAALAELEILGDEERAQLLVEWNATATEYERELCVHQLFEAQVKRTPDAVALMSGQEKLSYATLNARANCLARLLKDSGVGPEVVVGVLLDRSTEMVVALLAILKAGGAYVPLDPSYPRERLEFMLADSQAAVLLTNDKAAEGLDAGATRVICLDGTWGAIIAGQSAENLPNIAAANNLAYVIYTSGSTGRPKGAMITHQGLVNYLSWAVKHYEVARRSGAPVHSSISFDLTVTSLFSPLLSGRCAELLSEEQGVEGLAASLLNREEEFSLMKITPAHLMMLNHLLPPDKAEARVHTLVIGGEALRLDILESWRRAGKRLINEYGPTEAVVGCIVYEVSDDVVIRASAPEMVLIGRPIANAEVYILDERLQPVAIGTPGEIFLGGDGVARGYLNRPDVTAEKFVPHPFAVSSGRRLYRTGDLGRYLPNGEIEYLGRTDYQVKVRGYRIELGEIESCLREHEKVSEAVVTLHEDASGSGHLIAYVLSADKARVPENELRRHLTERLPEYMVPARLVFLEELPLTPNGKVDRRALPPPEQVQAQGRERSSEPHSLLEEMLADVWSHVLSVKEVGVHDNFFELGGHSLLAMRLISRLREVFGVEPTIDDIFETDTLSDLAKRLSELIGEQQTGKSLPLQRVERDGEIPLSFAQQRLWFLDQLTPGSFAYNVPAAFRVRGPLNISALEQSLNEMLRRHESLRTTFADSGGKPRQVIAAEATIALPVIDLSYLDADQQQQDVMRLAAEEARKPFDLARGPLLRVSLLRLGVDDYVVLSTMHHIISDGWSMGVLINEVAVLYEAFRAKRESPLPELPIQYADYAVWQRSWLSDEVLETQLAFWRNQMENAPPVLNLPTDYHRPAMVSHRGATLPVTLSAELGTTLKSLSRGEGMTSFMTILAAFAALLSRYSGQRDLVIGVPVAGRNRVEIEKLIGFFINTLPLRIDLEGDPSFRTLLRRVRQTMLGAYAHQDIPFEKLVEALHPARDRSRSPLFQVSFAWNNFELEALSVGELEMTPLEAGWQTAKFDLTLSLAENPSGTIAGDIEYATELFKADTVQRMARHFQTLLEMVVANPEKRLSELSVLTPDELQQVYRWNNTAKVYPEQDFLPELFASQVQRTPDAIAVVAEEGQVTYTGLNRRANRLAHHLRELGVGPEVLVGIMAERSIELVVGLLGILKAGGAYVPFETSNPPERLSYMLRDSDVSVLLTQSTLLDQLSGYAGVLVLLDTEDERVARASSTDFASNVFAENLAYMIYTSGSTGRPKGVMNTHSGIRNRLLWMQDLYNLQPDDHLLQKTPFCFDVSVWEFFWPLLNGGRLVMARPGGHRDSAYLRHVIAEQHITNIHFVPSMLRTFLDEPTLEGAEYLKRVICSGEEMTMDLQKHFNAQLSAELYNLYGPTEAAVEVSYWQCQPDDERGTVPIGRPISNTQLYILDRKLHPVPVGVINELYIGGVGLARGYLGQPGLTAEKFIPNPHSKVPGARLYRTGDLARYRADGAIEFAGRVDYQVKVRGYRMELGEIETVLSEHFAVHEAVVVAREDEAGGDKRLIAYVVADHSHSLDLGELRRHAHSHLPDYMLPAAFVLLDQMPLTATGKVNYRALPDPDQQRPEGVTEFVAPRTPFEETLCEIWSDLLRIKQIGVNDNFFDLGGHSLLATQMVSRIRDAFQVELPLATLFEFPTISELTKAIATARVAQEDASEITQMLEQLKQLTPDDVKVMLKTAAE